MKQLFVGCLLILMFSGLQAQKEGRRKKSLYSLKVGTSLTYIWDIEENEHQEYTWAINAAWQFSNRFSAGLNLMTIWDQSPFREQVNAFIAGPYAQFKFTDGRTWDLYGESGIYLGNYCSCDGVFDVPYQRNGLVYWSQGLGTNIRLGHRLQLDLAFINHIILNDVPQKYNFTQYIIGLDFFFVKN